MLAFYKNFLQGRKQFVMANSMASEEREVTSGTPQEVCLSPLFFCLYISSVVALLDTYTKEEAKKRRE